MKKILINVSNYPSTRWNKEEKNGFEKIIDITCPIVQLEDTTKEIENMAIALSHDILSKVVNECSIDELVYVYYDGDKALGIELYSCTTDEVMFATKKVEIKYENNKKVHKFIGWRFHR